MKTATKAILVGSGLLLSGLFAASTLPAQETLRQAHLFSGDMAFENGDFVEAKRLFRLAIAAAEVAHVQDELLAKSFHGLARTFGKLSDYEDAESHYHLALSLYQKFGWPDASRRVAAILNDLAILSESRDKSAEAKTFRQLASEIDLDQLEQKAVNQFAGEEYSSAKKTCEAAIEVAEKVDNTVAVKKFTAHLAVIQTALELQPQIEHAIDTLDKTSNEPEASLVLGRFLCFVKQDWENGLPVLIVSANESQYAPVLVEQENPPSLERQLYLADLWWDLARDADPGERVAMQRRAIFWYMTVLPRLPAGFERVKVQRRVVSISVN